MKDLTHFDYYIVTLHQAFECQELQIINGEEATEVAERLRKFCKGIYTVTLEGIDSGEAVFDSEGEYKEHINARREELPF